MTTSGSSASTTSARVMHAVPPQDPTTSAHARSFIVDTEIDWIDIDPIIRPGWATRADVSDQNCESFWLREATVGRLDVSLWQAAYAETTELVKIESAQIIIRRDGEVVEEITAAEALGLIAVLETYAHLIMQAGGK